MGGKKEWRLFVSQQECARKISDVFLFDLRGQLKSDSICYEVPQDPFHALANTAKRRIANVMKCF